MVAGRSPSSPIGSAVLDLFALTVLIAHFERCCSDLLQSHGDSSALYYPVSSLTTVGATCSRTGTETVVFTRNFVRERPRSAARA